MIVKLNKLYLYALVFIAFISAILPVNVNIFNANIGLEILFACICILYFIKFKSKFNWIQCAIIFYLIYYYFISISIKNQTLEDTIYPTKFLFYFILFYFIKNFEKQFISMRHLEKFGNIVIYIFLFKYLASSVTDYSVRPTLFIENNFELLMPLIISAGIWGFRGFVKLHEIIFLFIIIYLSKSLSSTLEFLALFVFSVNKIQLYGDRFLELKKNHLVRIILYLIPISILLLVLAQRSISVSSFENIDRYRFFMVFLNEAYSWHWTNWIFGTPPITPLSSSACSELSFYSGLFSKREGSCFSVILHSMNLRIVYDHGILGFLLTYLLLWNLLKNSFFKNVFHSIFAILLINGLSVSSLNSIYFAIPLSILLLSVREIPKKDKSRL